MGDRHYGLEVTDRVGFRGLSGPIRYGEVVGFDFLDNNRATVRFDDGTEQEVVAEWCTKVTTLPAGTPIGLEPQTVGDAIYAQHNAGSGIKPRS